MTEIRQARQGVSSGLMAAAAAWAMVGFATWTLASSVASAQQAARRERTEPVADIRAAAVAYVKSQLPASEVADISAGALDERLRLARCAAALTVQPIAGNSAMARSTVGVSCRAPTRWMVYVPVSVVRHIPVLILKHAVARGMHVLPADVIVQTRDVTGFSTAFLGSPSELGGRSAERTLAADTPLTIDMFTSDPIVRRGQEVTLVVQVGGIEVRAAGRALQDAGSGARLKVENVSSQKVVEGVAESSGIVEVGD